MEFSIFRSVKFGNWYKSKQIFNNGAVTEFIGVSESYKMYINRKLQNKYCKCLTNRVFR